MELNKRWQKPEVNLWGPFERWSSLRNELSSLLENPFLAMAQPSRFLNGWAPAIDLYEDRDHFTVKAELPGMKKEAIELTLQSGLLSIAGERKNEEYQDSENSRTERFFGRFTRSIALPAPVDSNGIKASYKDGILTITVPKSEEAKPKQIQVDVK